MSILNSWLRIAATACVFVFHANGLSGHGSAYLLSFAFPAFMFLSGYYSLKGTGDPYDWILKRLKKIYVPYIIVCLGVIFSNELFRYKQVSLWDYAALLSGLNFFYGNRFYVEAWFITVILLFYVSVFLINLCKGLLLRFLGGVLLAVSLVYVGVSADFVKWFCIGCVADYAVREWSKANGRIHAGRVAQALKRFSLAIQDYSYEFFLLHGGVLLLFHTIFKASGGEVILYSLLVSIALSVALKIVAGKIENTLLPRLLPLPRGQQAKPGAN